MKKIKGLFVLSMTAFVLAACGGDTTTAEPDTSTPEESTEENGAEETDASAAEEGRVFTLEELSEYNGQDGNPAYVAVDGVVYDVSGIGVWEGGEHFNGVMAGADNTEEISASPHGSSVLEDLPIVGTLE
ncbi:hypothetical protein JCM9140_2732 [Halalkalibacter wakoensis JCM 9140]|uniref:Cytochrome b5 heme-binding domain-containing protein n=1 Tax=Halalkalibacter wakoensis JCM 9140 TaxID=1236970 RepID=W4Q4K6_9BACI|nr:cytochrome b5 domain-containing protein [Halalkalibacter wakoensis]GAE26648.1 hypothetical protein JCM9140_2732 [Halalkalibacter wakoensis JCM 9140]